MKFKLEMKFVVAISPEQRFVIASAAKQSPHDAPNYH